MKRRRATLARSTVPPAAGASVPPDGSLHSSAIVISPLASNAALDPSVFAKVAATEAIPKTWEERARRTWG